MNTRAIVPASETLPDVAESARANALVELLIKYGPLSSFNALIQPRQERSIEQARQEIVRQLRKLEVAQALEEQLQPHLAIGGRRLVKAEAEHPYGKRNFTYTALQNEGLDVVALAQLPPSVFTKIDESGNWTYLNDFTDMVKVFRGKIARLFSEGCEGMGYAFRTAVAEEKKTYGSDVRFVPWQDMDDLCQGRLNYWQALEIDQPSVLPRSPAASPKALDVDVDAEEEIVEILVRASMDYKTSQEAFGYFVKSSGWPPEWVTQCQSGWSDDRSVAARDFLMYVNGKGTFPLGANLGGRDVMGEFLRNLIDKGTLGYDDIKTLVLIVVKFQLVQDLDAFKKKYGAYLK